MPMKVQEHSRDSTYPHAHTRIHSLPHTHGGQKPSREVEQTLFLSRTLFNIDLSFHHFPYNLPFLSHSVTAMAKDLGSLPRLTFLRNAQKHS